MRNYVRDQKSELVPGRAGKLWITGELTTGQSENVGVRGQAASTVKMFRPDQTGSFFKRNRSFVQG